MSKGLEKWRNFDWLTVRGYRELKKRNLERGGAFELTVRWIVLRKGFGLRFLEAGKIIHEEPAVHSDIVDVAIEAQFKLEEMILKRESELAQYLKDQQDQYILEMRGKIRTSRE